MHECRWQNVCDWMWDRPTDRVVQETKCRAPHADWEYSVCKKQVRGRMVMRKWSSPSSLSNCIVSRWKFKLLFGQIGLINYALMFQLNYVVVRCGNQKWWLGRRRDARRHGLHSTVAVDCGVARGGPLNASMCCWCSLGLRSVVHSSKCDCQ